MKLISTRDKIQQGKYFAEENNVDLFQFSMRANSFITLFFPNLSVYSSGSTLYQLFQLDSGCLRLELEKVRLFDSFKVDCLTNYLTQKNYSKIRILKAVDQLTRRDLEDFFLYLFATNWETESWYRTSVLKCVKTSIIVREQRGVVLYVEDLFVPNKHLLELKVSLEFESDLSRYFQLQIPQILCSPKQIARIQQLFTSLNFEQLFESSLKLEKGHLLHDQNSKF